MRIMLMIFVVFGVAACQPHHGGSVHVDGVGGASWNGDRYHNKGCPPGLAKQGRC